MLSENYSRYNLGENNPLTLTLSRKERKDYSLFAPIHQRGRGSIFLSPPLTPLERRSLTGLTGGDEGEGDKPKVQRGFIHKAFLAFCIIIFCSFSGCGKEGLPRIPGEIPVLQIKNIKGEAREGEVELVWRMPKKGEESQLLLGVKEFRVYRLSPGKGRSGEKRGGFDKIGNLPVKESGDLLQEIRYVDRNSLIRENWYHYVVACSDIEDKLIAVSDTVDVFFSFEPEPPKNLKAELKEDYILLQWDPPSIDIEGKPVMNVVGYNVYRKRPEQKAYVAVNKTLIKKEKYRDMGLERDEAYYYLVRAVDNHYPPWHESADSNIIQIANKDLIPPKAPKNLTVIGGIGRISLSWEKNMEPDLAGYRVYRSKAPGKDYELFNNEFIREEFFDDISVVKGEKYFYVITAVDNSKNANESSFSNEERGVAE